MPSMLQKVHRSEPLEGTLVTSDLYNIGVKPVFKKHHKNIDAEYVTEKEQVKHMPCPQHESAMGC